MKISIISLGRGRSSYHEQEEHYLKQLRGDLALIDLNTGRFKSLPDDQRRQKEAELLWARVPERACLTALDPSGQELNSLELARFIGEHRSRPLFFAIGGPLGWDASVRSRATAVLSLSQLTFTSQLSRLILIEQVYRSLRIHEGRPYHK